MSVSPAEATEKDSPKARGLRRATRATGALVLAFFLACAFTPFSNLLGYWTSVPAELRPADAIIVLGAGGATPPGILDGPSLRKALYGIRLYRQGLAPVLLLSGAPDDGEQRGEVSLRVALAREHGVPADAILAETSRQIGDEPNTHGEAAHARKLLRSRGVRRVLLVTDSQHMRRARRLFEWVGFSVFTAPIDEISLDASTPEERLNLMRWIGEEWLARLYYLAAGYM
jgi:uncharacterized SAM-binding protein YcdF (DUF218 family)